MKIIANKIDWYEKSMIAWYYGSSKNNLVKMCSSDKTNDILGAGVYLYRTLNPKELNNKKIYIANIDANKYYIADNQFKLSTSDVINIFGKTIDCQKYKFATSPLWWGLEGWSILRIPKEEAINKVASYMQGYYDFDGMITEYQPTGSMMCLWRKYQKIPVSSI